MDYKGKRLFLMITSIDSQDYWVSQWWSPSNSFAILGRLH